MMRRAIFMCVSAALLAVFVGGKDVRAQDQQRAFGRVWGNAYGSRDWERFYHYPYVFYPQNYWGNEYYRSSESLYYRYPPEMRTPVYNKQWHNYYPQGRRYHWGHHFMLDVY
ncbi:MAG: calmodulin-binding protein [Pirellulaceae bacterium]